MAIIILILIALGLLIILILIGLGAWHTHVIKQHFETCNVIVSGKKGTGKDLLFQKVINTRKEKYKANIDYGKDYEHISLCDISVAPNTYQDFIYENIKKIHKVGGDGVDIYISDAGVYLPSQYDSILYKRYPSFPIYYALSRHLYVQNIHLNTQNLNRVWKALREQADYYIICKRVTKIGPLFILHYVTYDKYESACANLLPMGNRIFNKFSKAEQDQYRATNGEIKRRYSFIFKKSIHYDTRAFADILFDNIDYKTKQVLVNEPQEDIKWTLKFFKRKR